MDFKLFLTFLVVMVAITFAYEEEQSKEHIVSPLLLV